MIFYFLWGDPLFSHSLRRLESFVDDDLIAKRREAVLVQLELLYLEIQNLNRRIASLERWQREGDAREVWTINQLLLHVPAETAERILVDRKVNDMDPDFSFCEALGTKTPG